MPRSALSDVVPTPPTGPDPVRAAAGPSGGRAGRHRLARALFGAGGPFAAYPGPAAAVAAGELVLAANPAAERLLAPLMERGSGELRLAIQSALSGATVRLQPILLPGGGAEPLAVELTVLPFPDAGAALLLGRDVTLERSLRGALVDSRQRYKDLVEASSDFAWETGADGRFVFVSPRGALGYPAEKLVGRRPTEFVIAAEGADPAFPFLAREPLAEVELRFRAASGTLAWLTAACRPVFDAEGVWTGTRGLCRDVTESRNREAELARLRHRERLLAYLVRTIRFEVDPRNAASAAATAALPALAAEGCRVHRSESAGRFAVVTECGSAAPGCEHEALAAITNGQERYERLDDGRATIAVPIRHGRRLSGALVLWRPADLGPWDEDDQFLVAELADQLEVVLQQIASQETLATLSRTDPLTGIINRRSFVEALEERLGAAGKPAAGALLYMDLDNFKPVNDRLGHAAGDAVLVDFARLLRECTRASDLVARLGGDEFAVWLDGIDEAAAVARARDILRRVEEDLRPRSAGPDLPLGSSIGIAPVPAGGADRVDCLIARADRAMYEAKRRGKQRVAIAPAGTGS